MKFLAYAAVCFSVVAAVPGVQTQQAGVSDLLNLDSLKSNLLKECSGVFQTCKGKGEFLQAVGSVLLSKSDGNGASKIINALEDDGKRFKSCLAEIEACFKTLISSSENKVTNLGLA